MWDRVGVELSLKVSAPQLLWFGINSVLKILNKSMTKSINQSIDDKGVYRIAPATPGLLIDEPFGFQKTVGSESEMTQTYEHNYIYLGTS